MGGFSPLIPAGSAYELRVHKLSASKQVRGTCGLQRTSLHRVEVMFHV